MVHPQYGWATTPGSLPGLIALSIWLPLRNRFVATQTTTSSTSNPYVSKGVLVLHDTLAAETPAGWSLKQNAQGQCFFADGAYRIKDVQEGFMEVCLANETYFINFAYEVHMTFIACDCGGLAFRATFPQLYYFLVCVDGRYRFVRFDKDNAANTRIIAIGTAAAVQQGLNKTNVLAVVANGGTFALYVNRTLVVRGADNVYLDGQIGLLAHTCRMVYYNDPRPNLCDAPTEVAFNEARVWKM